MKLFDLILFLVIIYFLYIYFYDNTGDSETDSQTKTDTESSKETNTESSDETDTESSDETDTESSDETNTESSKKTDTESSDEIALYNENKRKYTNATIEKRFRYKSRDILTNESIKDEKFVELKNEINKLLNSDPDNENNIYKQKNFYKHVPFESYEELYDLYEKNIVLFFQSNFNI